MNNIDSLITICIPTYKRFDYIFELIKSIPKNIPIVISDNGNFITNEFSEYSNIKVCHTEKVLPMFSNWNNAIQGISSKWFIIPGDDDLFRIESFDNIPSVLQKYKDAGMIVYGHDIIDDNLIIRKGWIPEEEKLVSPPYGFWEFQRGVDARVPSIIFNTEKFKIQGMFDERFQFTAADSFIIQKMSLAYPTAFITRILGIYRIWENNFTNQRIYTKGWFDQLIMWLREISVLIQLNNDKLNIDIKSFTSRIYTDNVRYAIGIMRRRHLSRIQKAIFLLSVFNPSIVRFKEYTKIIQHKY